MTTMAIINQMQTVPFANTNDYAVSAEAEILRSLFEEIREARSMSIALGRLSEAQAAAHEAFEEASDDSWDGHGASPADPMSYGQALSFLSMLPPSIPFPSIAVDPDGDFFFEWSETSSTDRVLMSINRLGRVSYAALFGPNEVHGTEYFAGSVPSSLLMLLDRLCR